MSKDSDGLTGWLREIIKTYAMTNGISKKEALDRLIKKLKKMKG